MESLYCSMSYLLIKKTTADDDDDDDEGVMSCGCIQRDCPRR